MLLQYAKFFNRLRLGYQPIFLDYPVKLQPRWTAETEGNPHLAEIIKAGRSTYVARLEEIAQLAPTIPKLTDPASVPSPVNWRNGLLPALDGLSLMWAARRAKKTIIEVGSGNSTQFLRAALALSGSQAKLVSIDPSPRVGIDTLCDTVIRQPLENIDLVEFDRLEPDDVVFFDNSHRSFMNSDVTVAMLDVIPRLPRGVLIGFHDIFLPYDYFETWSQRAYNEQYMLGSFLLAGAAQIKIELANYWLYKKGLHLTALDSIWTQLGADIRDRPPSAFWFRLNANTP